MGIPERVCRFVVSVYHIPLYFIESKENVESSVEYGECEETSHLTLTLVSGGGDKSTFCNTEIPRQPRGCGGVKEACCITKSGRERARQRRKWGEVRM